MLLNFSSGYFWLQGRIPPCRESSSCCDTDPGVPVLSFPFSQRPALPDHNFLHDALPSHDSILTLGAIRLLCCPWLHCRWSVQVTLSSSLVRAAHGQQTCNAQVSQTAQEAPFLPQIPTASQVSFFSPEPNCEQLHFCTQWLTCLQFISL